MSPTDAVVLGFAETATALGHSVAEALGGADYLHSTRRPVPGFGTAGAFTEEHSHHTEHLLLPSDPGVIAGSRPLVLVDDELSTGRTVVNTIAALHRVAPREHYVVAALVDLREHPLTGLPDGVRVDVVSLTRAALSLPDDLAERATALRAELQTPRGRTRAEPAAPSDPTGRATPPHAAQAAPSEPTERAASPHAEPVARSDRTGRATPPPVEPPASSDRTGRATPLHAEVGAWAGRTDTGAERPPADGRAARVALTDLGWPADLPAGGRHGFTPAHHRALAAILPEIAAGLARAADVRADERTLVLGTEELMALPLHLAAALAAQQNATPAGVWFSTTTRSPAFVVDEPDYALTSGITFPAHDDPADGPGPRHAYNVAQGWDHVLVVVDPPAETPALHTGLLAALAPHTRRVTVVVTS